MERKLVRERVLLAVENFVNEVLSDWDLHLFSNATLQPDFDYIVSNRWNKQLVYCRRAPAQDYLARCWRDREAPDPRRLAIAVCPWLASRRSWK